MSFSLCTELTTSHKYEWLVGCCRTSSLSPEFLRFIAIFCMASSLTSKCENDKRFLGCWNVQQQRKIWWWISGREAEKNRTFLRLNLISIRSPDQQSMPVMQKEIYWVLNIIKKLIGGLEWIHHCRSFSVLEKWIHIVKFKLKTENWIIFRFVN